MILAYKSIKEYPDVPVGSEFVWDEESQVYVFETDSKIITYLKNEIETRKDFFEPVDILDEFDDDPLKVLMAETKDNIDMLPMDMVAEVYTYINEKRLGFVEVHEMKMMQHKMRIGEESDE